MSQPHAPSIYPMTAGTSFRGYPLVTTASGLPRFSPAGLIPAHPGLGPPHPGIPHPAIVTPGPKQDVPVSSVSTQENHLSCYFLPPLSSTNGMLYPSYHGNQLSSNPSTSSPDFVYQLTLDLRSLKHGQPQDGRVQYVLKLALMRDVRIAHVRRLVSRIMSCQTVVNLKLGATGAAQSDQL
uniref:Uncharacterized protein n=1 Tax=Strigamia maritima TaxID=126957 RepID=T1JD01_STRMM